MFIKIEYMYVFIEVSVYTCISIRVFTVFIKKEETNHEENKKIIGR
jgi:hypothetical protein